MKNKISSISIICMAAMSLVVSSCSDTPKNENALRADTVTDNKIERDSIKNAMEPSEITFVQSHHDFGTVKEGVRLAHEYVFKNTGDKPLYISDVISPCGCTVPEYDKQPILPGKEGKIKIEFNTEGRVGNQEKKLTVIANIPQEHTFVSFKATVEEK